MPAIDFDGICAEITMDQVLSLLGFQPSQRSGAQWDGSVRSDKSTSRRRRWFSVNVESGPRRLPSLPMPR